MKIGSSKFKVRTARAIDSDRGFAVFERRIRKLVAKGNLAIDPDAFVLTEDERRILDAAILRDRESVGPLKL